CDCRVDVQAQVDLFFRLPSFLRREETRMRRLMFAFALLVPGLALADFGYVPGVQVTVAPPPVRVEARPIAPSPNHIWIGGHWGWRGGRHEWMGGHWVMPPGAGYRWVDARWANEGGRWTFFEGHWAPPMVMQQPIVEEPAQPEVIVDQAPPAPIVEAR